MNRGKIGVSPVQVSRDRLTYATTPTRSNASPVKPGTGPEGLGDFMWFVSAALKSGGKRANKRAVRAAEKAKSAAKLRWGILGAAEIARKNWSAIRLTGNGTLAAVASRDLERCRRFIADCQAEAPFDPVPQALGRYEDLLAADEVDAVYVPLPTGVRKEWVVRAAQAGKHVVCEKPCAVSVADLQEMVAACRRHNVQFMDGVMFVHSRRLGQIADMLRDGRSVGEIRRITSAFTFRAAPEFFVSNIRAHSELEPHGCLGDLGWYCLRLSLWAMDWQMPCQVTGRLLAELGRRDSPGAVPMEFSGELAWTNGVSAGFYCSFLAGIQQWAMISGTRGCVRVDDFVLPFQGDELGFELVRAVYHIRGCDFRMQPEVRRVRVQESSHNHATAQETNLFRQFAEQVRSGRFSEAWVKAALTTQAVMDGCLASARANGRPLEPPNALGAGDGGGGGS